MNNTKKKRLSLVVTGMLLVVAWMAWPEKSPEEPLAIQRIASGDSGISGLTDSAEEPETGSGQPPLFSDQDAEQPLTSVV